MTILSFEHVDQILSYQKETGAFVWKVDMRRGLAGKSAGTINKRFGYLRIEIGGKTYSAHRLAWLLVHRVNPEGHVDHINRNKLDNRISNLRIVTRSENAQNIVAPRSDSNTGVRGVSFWPSRGYVARIMVSGKSKFIGTFATLHEAADAYANAKRHFHPVAFSVPSSC